MNQEDLKARFIALDKESVPRASRNFDTIAHWAAVFVDHYPTWRYVFPCLVKHFLKMAAGLKSWLLASTLVSMVALGFGSSSSDVIEESERLSTLKYVGASFLSSCTHTMNFVSAWVIWGITSFLPSSLNCNVFQGSLHTINT